MLICGVNAIRGALLGCQAEMIPRDLVVLCLVMVVMLALANFLTRCEV